MPRARTLFGIISALSLFACKGGGKKADIARLESPASEAALRYMLEHCPKRSEVKVVALQLGEPPRTPAAAFFERFKNVPGVKFMDHANVKHGVQNGVVRRWDPESSQPVLFLQIGSLTEPNYGVQEAKVAWEFKDDREARRLEVKAKPEGGYDVRELEIIPLPHRNDDTGRPPQK